MSITVEAREVLTHLNALGYRNISAGQLKEFMKDLKKLIKYEDRIEAFRDGMQHHQFARSSEPSIFDKLHDNRTKSIEAKYAARGKENRAKSVSPARQFQPKVIIKEENPSSRCSVLREAQNTARSLPSSKDVHSTAKSCNTRKETQTTIKPSNVQLKETQTRPQSAMTTSTSCGKQKSNLDSGRRPKTPKTARKSTSEASSQRRKEKPMWIRPPLKKPQAPKTMDSVQLYHYYQKEWAKFKQQLPGENDHSELRWQIRHKLMGDGS